MESDDSKWKKRGRGGGSVVLIDEYSEKPSETTFPSVQAPPSATHELTTPGHILVSNITPCPRFDRLRTAAKVDRYGIHVKRFQEARRAEEARQRHATLSQAITMGDFYATLFRPAVSGGNVVDSGGGNGSVTTLPVSFTQPLQYHDRDDVLKDVEDSFIACYYKMYPEALRRHNEAKEEAERIRRSTLAAAQLASFSGELTRKRTGGSQVKGKKIRTTRKEAALPREGAPAANLSVLITALITAGDSRGNITQEALAGVLAKAPFEVHDASALEAFFFAVHALSTAKESVESESERPLNNSYSTTTTSVARGSRRTPSLWTANAQNTPSAAALPPTSPVTSAIAAQGSVRRGQTTAGGSFSSIRRHGFTPRPSRCFNASAILPVAATALSGGGVSAAEILPAPVVRVREVLAAVDALINGPELRDVVRSICFSVLETDGFIHKATLRTLRLTHREACEDKDAVVTPSIVKTLTDAIEILLQEEEKEYIHTQLKDKRRKNKGKIPALLPHQKSAIPLHMMRRAHMTRKEFFRFFDELPFLAASFMHIWFCVFFSTTWPPTRPERAHDTHTDDTLEENFDGNDSSNNTNNNMSNMTWCGNLFSHGTSGELRSQGDAIDWEKIATEYSVAWLCSPIQRRNTARRIVSERLDYMKLSTPENTGAMLGEL